MEYYHPSKLSFLHSFYAGTHVFTPSAHICEGDLNPFYHIQLVRYNIYLRTPVLLRKRDWLKLAEGQTSTSGMQQHVLSIVLCFAVRFMYACKCVCVVLCFFSQMEERSRAKHQGAREAAGFLCLLLCELITLEWASSTRALAPRLHIHIYKMHPGCLYERQGLILSSC